MATQLRFQRQELKYYLPQELYSELIRLIRPYMTLDKYLKNGAKNYLVRSLYLDTDDLKFYYEKLAGLHTRKKFRIRAYSDAGSKVFLEIKRRYNDTVVKDRTTLDYSELHKVLDRYGRFHTDGKKTDYEKEVIKSYQFFVPMLQLRPTVLVAYDREAHIGVFDDSIRLTMDRNLRCMPGRLADDVFYTGKDWRYVNKPCILELKFNNALPFFFKRLIQQLDLWRESISKYCLCIERINGQIG